MKANHNREQMQSGYCYLTNNLVTFFKSNYFFFIDKFYT